MEAAARPTRISSFPRQTWVLDHALALATPCSLAFHRQIPCHGQWEAEEQHELATGQLRQQPGKSHEAASNPETSASHQGRPQRLHHRPQRHSQPIHLDRHQKLHSTPHRHRTVTLQPAFIIGDAIVHVIVLIIGIIAFIIVTLIVFIIFSSIGTTAKQPSRTWGRS